eukprot:1779954-Prymnesium_polylepis.2
MPPSRRVRSPVGAGLTDRATDASSLMKECMKHPGVERSHGHGLHPPGGAGAESMASHNAGAGFCSVLMRVGLLRGICGFAFKCKGLVPVARWLRRFVI